MQRTNEAVKGSIQISQTPHQAETSQTMCSRNELVRSYKTQALTEKIFQTDDKTQAKK